MDIRTCNIIVQSVCVSLVSGMILFRLYVRLFVMRAFGKDDWACLFGWLLSLVYSAATLIMSHFALELQQNATLSNIMTFKKSVYGTVIIYSPCVLLVKLSILLLLLRVFSPLQRITRLVRVIIILLVGYHVPMMMVKILMCRPVRLVFSAETLKDNCFEQHVLILADAIISVITDTFLLVLPLPLVSALHIPLKHKFRVAILFSAGGAGCGASVIRLVTIVRYGIMEELTWNFAWINIWGMAEVHIGLLCACLPIFPASWKHIQPRTQPVIIAEDTIPSRHPGRGSGQRKFPGPSLVHDYTGQCLSDNDRGSSDTAEMPQEDAQQHRAVHTRPSLLSLQANIPIITAPEEVYETPSTPIRSECSMGLTPSPIISFTKSTSPLLQAEHSDYVLSGRKSNDSNSIQKKRFSRLALLPRSRTAVMSRNSPSPSLLSYRAVCSEPAMSAVSASPVSSRSDKTKRKDKTILDRIKRISSTRETSGTPDLEDVGQGDGFVKTEIYAERKKKNSNDFIELESGEDVNDTLKIVRTVEVRWNVE